MIFVNFNKRQRNFGPMADLVCNVPKLISAWPKYNYLMSLMVMYTEEICFCRAKRNVECSPHLGVPGGYVCLSITTSIECVYTLGKVFL